MDSQTAVGEHRTAAAAAREAQPNSRSTACITASEVIPPLAGALALVRPVGMSEEAAAEWLAVAAAELAGYDRPLLLSSLGEARKRCTHHGQIVAFVINDMEERTPWRLGKPLHRELPAQADREALPPPSIRGLIDNATRSLSANRGRG
jgi:hypothetical protein